MSGPDLRKFMNILNESFEAPVNEGPALDAASARWGNANVTSGERKIPMSAVTLYDDDLEFALKFASEEDARLWDEIFTKYSGQSMEDDSFSPVGDGVAQANKVVPAGALAELADAIHNAEEDGVMDNDETTSVWKAAHDIIERFMIKYDSLGESTVMETGNANAQQKGINFSGTPANKNKGDMDQTSPKATAKGSKSPLAQTKSGTNVGQIKS